MKNEIFKGLHFGTFLSTYQEWHALVEGFCEGFCIRRPRYDLEDELLNDLIDEHHYYNMGRVLGFCALIGIIVGIAKVIIC